VNQISKTRFVITLALMTIGFGLLMVPGMTFGWSFIIVGNFISMGRQRARAALNRPIRRSDVIWILLGLAGFAAVGIGCHYFVSDRGGEFFVRIMSHPAFVIPLWAIAVWVHFRRWKRRPHVSIGPPLVRPAARA